MLGTDHEPNRAAIWRASRPCEPPVCPPVQTGVQVLFAFLLTAPLAARFRELSRFQRYDHFETLLTTGAATIPLIAPTAYHRILFRRGDKEYLVAGRQPLHALGWRWSQSR